MRAARPAPKVTLVKDPNVVPASAEQRDLIERLLQARIDGVTLVIPTKDIPHLLSPAVAAVLDGTATPDHREPEADQTEPAREIYLTEGMSSLALLNHVLHRHQKAGPGASPAPLAVSST